MRLVSNITFLIAVLATAASCGGKNPIQPPPPPPPAPELGLSCPARIVREATAPEGTDVHFDAPTPTGGRPPYDVQCSPGSSSVFAVGDTTVTCTATDADMAQASCGFGVTVRVSQMLAKTKFVAFGDSITDGKVSLLPLIFLAEPDTYPYKLEQMLRQRFPTQVITVVNEGNSGEKTTEGEDRLPSVLETEQPDVLLLLEGVNAVRELATSIQATALQHMIREAQRRGVDVIIATVMPISDQREKDKPGTTTKILALNEEILELADDFGLGPVVDLFALFQANPHLLGVDGLHPTAEGQTRIAEAFRDEIVRRYDIKATMSSRLSTMRLSQ
jgi:lysophospholipase L1-like esterase